MKTNIIHSAGTARKRYAAPLTQTVDLGVTGKLMKITGPESLPEHAGGAPKRRTAEVF